MDDAVDAMNRAAYKALTKVMEEQSHMAPQALNALMICRAWSAWPITRRTSPRT